MNWWRGESKTKNTQQANKGSGRIQLLLFVETTCVILTAAVMHEEGRYSSYSAVLLPVPHLLGCCSRTDYREERERWPVV